MATRSSIYNKIVNKEEEKKNKEVVCCLDCFWASLMQYGTNPVLAQCRKKPNVGNAKFPYEVMVAAAKWICPLWKYQDPSEKTILPRVRPSDVQSEKGQDAA